MKDIKKRFLTGSVIFVVFVSIVLLTLKVHWAFLDVFVLLLSVFASYEISNAISKKFPKPLYSLILIAIAVGYSAFIIAQQVVNIGGITSFYCVMLLMCIVAIVWTLCSKKISTNNVVSTMFVMIYPVSFLLYLMSINHMIAPFRANVLLITFAVAPLTDTFAFFVGSLIKGKKLCPKISPNKTISGAIGGTLGGTLGGLALYFISSTSVGSFLGMGAFTLGSLDWIHFVCMGLICSIFTQLGDLFASYIKRIVGIKDYSNLLPGHGGIMDRIDGLIMGGIAVYLYAVILMTV